MIIAHICHTCGIKFTCNTKDRFCIQSANIYTCGCRTCSALTLGLSFEEYIDQENAPPCFKDIKQKLVNKVVYEALLVERKL